jgi:peptidoglycan/LPS O-acetylase OafA/YrhL
MISSTKASWNPRFGLLDNARGIAILGVMLFHGFATSYGHSVHPWVVPLQWLARQGWLGIDIFFVISGYSIASNIYSSVPKGAGPSDFIKGRIWRIVPAYWAAFLGAIGVAILAIPFNGTSLEANVPHSFLEWFGNLFFLQTLLHRPFYVVSCWFIADLVGFYLLTTFFFWVGRVVSFRLGLALVLISAFLAVPFCFRWPILSLWIEYVSGVLVFYALWQFREKCSSLAAFMVLLLLACVPLGYREFVVLRNPGPLTASLFSLALLMLYRWDTYLSAWAPLSWLKWFGTISYSLYLCHIPIQGRVVNLGMRFAPFVSLKFFGVQVLGWAAAIVVSYAFYRYVEKPIQEFRRQQEGSYRASK